MYLHNDMKQMALLYVLRIYYFFRYLINVQLFLNGKIKLNQLTTLYFTIYINVIVNYYKLM